MKQITVQVNNVGQMREDVVTSLGQHEKCNTWNGIMHLEEEAVERETEQVCDLLRSR